LRSSGASGVHASLPVPSCRVVAVPLCLVDAGFSPSICWGGAMRYAYCALRHGLWPRLSRAICVFVKNIDATALPKRRDRRAIVSTPLRRSQSRAIRETIAALPEIREKR